MEEMNENITSCDIIIRKKKRNGDGYIYDQLHGYYDGYPEGVGETLQSFVLNVISDHELILPNVIGHMLIEIDICSHFEHKGNKVKLDRLISYLYVVDVDERMVYCYNVDLVDLFNSTVRISDEEIISSDFNGDDNAVIKKKLIYKASFGEKFYDIKMNY